MNVVDKRRGAPKGRRPVIWICAAMVESNLVCEKFAVYDQSPDSVDGVFPKENAVKQFFNKYKVNPETVLGPLFEKKGLKKVPVTRKRLSIDRENIDKYTLAADRQNAIYGAWKGYVNVCLDDAEKAFFVPISRIDDGESKKNPPGAGIVNISDLMFE